MVVCYSHNNAARYEAPHLQFAFAYLRRLCSCLQILNLCNCCTNVLKIFLTFAFFWQFKLFVKGIYSTEELADKQVHLQNNYRHIHPTYGRPVYASKDAKMLTNGVSPLDIFSIFNVLLFIGFLNI